jgi:hypothetical protein
MDFSPLPWTAPDTHPDGRDAAGRPQARIQGVPVRLLSAGPRTCRWTTPPGHRLVLDGPRLGLVRDSTGGPVEMLLRAPFRADLPDGGLAEALAAACAAAARGALLAALLGLHPAQRRLPEGTRLHLHDARTFSISGRVLLPERLRARALAPWLGAAPAPLTSPWRLTAAAIECAATDPPATAHGRLRLRAAADRLPPGLQREIRAWTA